MKTRMKMIAALLLAVLLLSAALPACAAEGGSQKLDTYYSLAVGYINKENYDKAMEYLDAALKLADVKTNAEMYADLHLKKGCVFTIRKDYANAEKELDEALRVKPDLAEAWLVKVQAYSESGRTAEAARSLEKYIELSGDASLNESLAQLYLQLEDNRKAEESYRKLAESVSADPADVPYNLAVYEIGAGMYTEALENLKKCKADPEKTPGLHYNTGVCHMMLEQYSEAAEAFTASIESENFVSDAMYNRAVCRMSLQDFRAAVEDFTVYIDGLNAAPEEGEAAGQPETGEAVAEAAEKPVETEAVPSDSGKEKSAADIAYYFRGVCFLSVEEFDQAAADFTVCIENGISETESIFNRGLSYLQSGKYEEAKADFTASIEKDYLADDALFYRSYTHRGLGDNEAALADLTLCVEHAYNLGQTYQQRAQVYQDMGDDDNYLKDLEASLDYLED